jgi:hypothetical protein
MSNIFVVPRAFACSCGSSAFVLTGETIPLYGPCTNHPLKCLACRNRGPSITTRIPDAEVLDESDTGEMENIEE